MASRERSFYRPAFKLFALPSLNLSSRPKRVLRRPMSVFSAMRIVGMVYVYSVWQQLLWLVHRALLLPVRWFVGQALLLLVLRQTCVFAVCFCCGKVEETELQGSQEGNEQSRAATGRPGEPCQPGRSQHGRHCHSLALAVIRLLPEVSQLRAIAQPKPPP